jgi:hypothetical protein
MILPKDVQVTPFSPKGLLNPISNTKFSGGPEGVDGLPSGHPNLNDSHPSLLWDFPRGILVVEVLLPPLRPQKVENEVAENVKWLCSVGEATNVVALGLGGVIFSFEDGFVKQDERLGGGDVGRCPRFLLDVVECLLSVFGMGAMLQRFRGLDVANLA